MARYVAQVKGATVMRETDINLVSEHLLVPLFKAIYPYPDLRNLNTSERANFPGIDLADDTERVAFQITATPDSEKVKETLRKFVQHGLYKRYDRLIVYIIIEKQKTYSGAGFEAIIDGKFVFDKDTDIQDYRDVLGVISTLPITQAQRIEGLLEAHFGDNKAPVFGLPSMLRTEEVFLNMVEVFFPRTLYVADIAKNQDDAAAPKRKNNQWHRHRKSKREQLISQLKEAGLRFSVDWEYHNNKIITFHDLDDTSLPLSHLIDEGTVTSLTPHEFYSIDDDHEDVFKSLLRRSLQQKLYRCHVKWQNEEKLFIFTDIEGEASRVETWSSSRINPREVFRRKMKEQEPDKISNCKHFAFETHFRRIAQHWYLTIKPDWFYSSDGYRKSFYGAEKVSWIKRRENNDSVANHVQFLRSFLIHEGSVPIAETISFLETPVEMKLPRTLYPFLSFGELVMFDTAPYLEDKAYLPQKPKQDKSEEVDNDDSDDSQQDELADDL
jgi:hypothetical protein